MSNEDSYVQNYVENHENIDDFWVEVAYNEYGERGYVDLVTKSCSSDGEHDYFNIIEVKSESAIREATGANEVVRQVNKMAGYFIDGQVNDIVTTEDYAFLLDVIDTKHNRKHLLENKTIYSSIHDSGLASESTTPRIEVRLVSEDGYKKCRLDQIENWIDDDMGPIDLAYPDRVAPISIINPDDEPESETFCHSHGVDRRSQKPMFKLNGKYHIAKDGYWLFYCPKCLVSLLNNHSEKPLEVLDEMGGYDRTAMMMLLQGGEPESISDIVGADDLWLSFEDQEKAMNAFEKEMV